MQDKNIDFSIFSRQLRSRMKAFGLTQVQLAERTGMSQPTVGRCLGGQAPRVEHLYSLANVLNVSMEELLTGEQSNSIAEEPAQYLAKIKDSKKNKLLKRRLADLKTAFQKIENLIEEE